MCGDFCSREISRHESRTLYRGNGPQYIFEANEYSKRVTEDVRLIPSNGLTGVLLLAFLLRMTGTSSLLGDTKPDRKQMCQH